MRQRSEYQPAEIPDKPGVYLLYDRFQKLLYVGKAKSLRKRLSTYFQPSRTRRAEARLRSLIHSIAWFDFRVVSSEQEALLLESQLIKEYMPRYNILLRDDKRFLLLKVDLRVEFPRIELVRLRKDDDARYFGPFPNASALRVTADALAQHFGLRVCPSLNPDEQDYKHCHADVIRRCPAPCVGKISAEDYRQRVMAMLDALEHCRIEPLCQELEEKMKQAAAKLDFETAARYRDITGNIRKVLGQPQRNFRYETSIRNYPGPAGVEAL